MKATKISKQYLPVVVALRGIAALAVCMFHFTKGFMAEDGFARELFKNGWMGVEVFFVISGFVIPYSLLDTSFAFKHYAKFFKKRVLRIEPAYLVSVVLIVGLNYIAAMVPGFAGDPFGISFELILQHIGYLVEFFNNEWLNPVYWTLAVEFHYYLLIGLLIAVWNLKYRWLTISSIIGILLLKYLNVEMIKLLKYTDIFVLGIITAFYKCQNLKLHIYCIALVLMAFFLFQNHGPEITILKMITAVLIAFFGQYGSNKLLLFFGNISYSLYLIHVPIGGKVINLSRRLELNENSKFIVILVALGTSIFMAWLFYKYIERPSHQWAKKVKFD